MPKVSTGQPFRMTAGDFNSFVDAAQTARNRALNRESGAVPRDTKLGIITIRNQSGADQNQFAVLTVTGVAITPTDNPQEFKTRATFNAASPDQDGQLNFVILQEPIRAGALGKAMAFGISPVMLNVIADNHKYAGVVNAQTSTLKTAATGAARILYKEAGVGQKWAMVYFPASAISNIRLGGDPLTKADDGATPQAHEVALNEALRIVDVGGGTYRLALNLSTLYVVDPATGRFGPLSAVLRLLANNSLALRTDAPFSDGTNSAALKMKYDTPTQKHYADGAFPV